MKAVNNYLKNVMKSVAYAAADVSDEYIPGVKEFADANKEFGTATYAALKNPSQFVRKQVQAIQESKVYKALDYGARNLSEDLRTGNFYNKARKERDELALSGLDADWDDLSDFGIDDDWESKLGSSSSKNDEITAGDMKIVESIEGSNAAVANATVNAVIASSQNEIKNNRANMAMIYSQNERLFGGLHKDMSILGSTMQQMYKLQSASLQNIDKNMSSFFTQESKLSTERNAILKEMLEMQRNMYKSASDKEKEAAAKKKPNRIRWSDININGTADLNAYFGAVKKNISNQLATMMPASFGEDGNMLAVMMTSPLEEAMKYVVNGVIPATVKAAAKEFDSSVSGIFGNIIGELGNARSKNDGGLLGTIAKFLGVSTGVNRNIDTSRYEKGPVPFDGITRKAIIDVIPTHLRRIEAALTGRPEEMFDYKAGRWIKVSTVKKQYEDIKKNAVKRATSELREAMNPGVQAVRKGITEKYDRDTFDKAIEEFEQFLYDNNGRFNPKVSASANNISAATYPNLYRHYSKIKTIFKDFDRIESKDRNGKITTRNTRNSVRMRLSNAVLDAKDSEEKQYRSIESEIGSIFQTYFGSPKADVHGKWNDAKDKFTAYNNLNNTKDNLGNTIFDYLQNINKELTWMRLNGVPGRGRGRGNSNKTVVDFSKIDITNPDKSRANSNNYDREAAERERVKKSALEAITSGKAIDLRDFDEDEQAYLLQLSSMASSGAISQYKSEIKGYNESELSGFMDKHFYKTNIKTMKDVEEAIKKAEKEGKNTSDIKMDTKEETFFKKLMKRIGTGGDVLGGLAGASAEAFTNVLYSADRAIYEMMYKTELEDDENKKKYNGFMDAMVGKMTDKFKEIDDKFEEDIIKPFKDKLGIDDKFKGRFKDNLINTGSRMWTAFKDANSSVYGPILDKYKPEMPAAIQEMKASQEKEREKERIAKNLRDKKAREAFIANSKEQDILSYKSARDARTGAIKSGNVSNILFAGKSHRFYSDDEHELEDILLNEGLTTKAELDKIRNSFYDKNKNFDLDGYRAALTKKYLRHVEKQHAKGTPSGRPFSGLTTLTKGEGLISGRGVGVVPKTGVYNVTTPTHIINTEDMHSLTGGTRVSVQSALGKEKLAAKAAGYNIAHHDKGTDSIKVGKNGEITTDELLDQAKKYIPEAASGGLIGAIVSTLLGVAGGPILGAAVGAGGSILASSDTLKDKLFGKLDKDNKRDGSGIISKTVVDSFNKYFPDMAKYGLAGIIPGLLTPLGPIGGLMVGGAFGYLKNNEKFTNKYFGEEGKLTISSKEKKIIQDMLPGALKGAGAGIIAKLFLPSPFGIMGNAAIGAAVGMMASTEEFKNGILGREINGERVGGIVGAFKDALDPLKESMRDLGSKLVNIFDKNIIDPIARFITPAIHAIPQVASIIPRKINEFFENKKFTRNIETFFADHVTRPIQGLVTKFLTPVTKTITSVITSPVRLLGLAGDKIRERQIKTGNADYMTAKERIEFMINKGKGHEISGTDKALADIGTEGGMSVDDAKGMASSLRTIYDTKDSVRASKRKQEKKINNILDSFTADGKKLSPKAKKELRKAIESGDMNQMRYVLTSYRLDGGSRGLSEGEADALLNGDGLGDEVKNYMRLKDRERAVGNGKKRKTKKDRENILNTLDPEILEKLGIDRDKFVSNRHYAEKFISNIETEILDREANGTNKDEVALDTENNKLFKSMATSLQDIRNAIILAGSGETDALKKLGIQHDEAYDSAMTDMKVIYDFNKEENEGYIGKELYDQFSDETKDILSAQSKGIFQLNKAEVANKNRTLIKKYKMTAKEVNACKGDVKKLAEVMKHGYHIKIKDIPYYNNLTGTDHKILIKYLKDDYVKAILTRRKLSKEDMEYGISANLKAVHNHLEYLARNNGGIKVGLKAYKNVQDAMGDLNNRKDSKFRSAVDFVFNGAEGFDDEEPAAEAERNGLGTMLLSGLFNAGKAVVKGTGRAIGGAGRAIGSLFKNRGTGDNTQDAGILASLLGGNYGLFNGGTRLSSTDNMDETDKAGDGKDNVHVGNGEIIQTRRDSSGNVEPDTSDSKTKSIINKLELKEKMTNKLQEAQLKAAEIIKTNFDTSDIKESKGGKIGWLSMLLMGGLLWNSGILQKLFNGLIKPIWTDHVKPWITNTAVPWVKSMWTDKVKPFLTDTVAPWILNTAIPALGNAFATVIGTLITQLPKLIWNGIKGVFSFGGTVLDVATDNKYNAGATTTVDASELGQKYGSDYETGMYDENGNTLTTDDITNGNYSKIYNAQGIEGTVNEDGTVSFKDDSPKGASYISTVGNAALHGFAKSLATGRTSLLTKGATGLGKLLSKGGTISKFVGSGVQALTKPVELLENLGVAARGKLDDKINKTAINLFKQARAEGTERAALDNLRKTIGSGDGSKLSGYIKKFSDYTDNGLVGKGRDALSNLKTKFDDIFKKGASEVVEEGAEKVAETATKKAAKNGGFLSKLISKLKTAIDNLFENSTVQSKLVKVAETLGETNTGKWISGFKNSVDNIFTEALEKGIKKVGFDTCKKAASKIFSIVLVIADFLKGVDQAESILGVSETTVVEELVAGLINAFCNFLIIPSIVPGTNWIARKLYASLDKDFESRQEEAKSEYEKYVEETGSTLTEEQYLARQNSLSGKIGGWFSDRGRDIKNFFSNSKTTTKAEDAGISTSDSNAVEANAIGTLNLSSMGSGTGIISSIIGNITDGGFKFDHLDKIMNKAKDGKISIFSKDYWKMPTNDDNSLKGTLQNTYTMLTKIINVPSLMIKGALDGLTSDITDIGDILSGTNSGSSNNSSGTTTNSTTTKTTFGSKIKNLFSSGINKIKSFFGFGTGSYQYGTGAYSKQIDPSIAGVRFNASGDTEYQTIGNSGCGPAAAVNAIESMYGRGNAVVSAAQYAINHGYKETDGGTKPGFFADYFNKNGFGSQTSYNKSDIERNINNGMPTVIMGRDSKGTSSSTPFGKTPHYVTVTGTDGRGNAIVQDPESKYDNQLYPVKSLMKNTSLGVSAFGKNYRFGRGKWGRGTTTPEPIKVNSVSEWIDALKTWCGIMVSDGNWVYSNSGNKTDYRAARAASKRYSNCALMVVHALQYAGLFDFKHKFYGNKSGKITMNNSTKERLNQIADIIDCTDKQLYSKDADLQAGDIVTYYGQHTNVYIGESNGAKLWYDAGRWTTVGKKAGSRWTSFLKTGNINMRISYIIRLKFNGTTTTSTTTSSSSSSDVTTTENPTIADTFSSILVNSRAGQALSQLAGAGTYGRGKWGRGDYAANIWWYLKQMGMTDAGAAGLMGNLYAESSLMPNNAEQAVNNYTGMSDDQYTAAVDNGTISKDTFLHPKGGKSQYGYGLAQWTSPGRKEGLYKLVKNKNVSIADLGAQLEWLGTELSDSYGGVLNTLRSTNSLADASNVVLTKFERPADQGASVKAKRQSYGTKYFNQYKGTTGQELTGSTLPGEYTSSDSSSSDTETEDPTILSILSNIINNSNAGQALNLLIGTSSSSSDSSYNSSGTTNTGSGDAATMIELAKKEVGVKETGTNYVKYNDWYYGKANSGGADKPWCAAFIAWLANQAGVSTDVIPKSASTKAIYSHVVNKGGKVSNSEAKPGDLALFTKDGAATGIYHIGLITANQDGTIATIEGNSSDAVKTRTYPSNNKGILVARPQYANAGTTTGYINSSTTTTDIPDYSNTRGSNGTKPLSRFGQFKDSIYGHGSDASKVTHKTNDGYVKVEESSIDRQLGNKAKSASRKRTYNNTNVGMGTARYGMAGTADYSNLINSIISILMTIAENTDKLNLIVTILNNKLGTSISASDVSNATTDTKTLKAKLANALNGINSSTSKYNTYADSVGDSSINSIISAMNAIASE